ncbi:hypothetical protein [Salipaludibacillus aurantiacus]|uniref:PTS cellobiose transporter subunit IIA n=1 Tax=Salipaludibacillus aurantiacus TaxID=1601833 RepID=A0A1H9UM30_9BACI|nr:hypothetical protein [Salipaludibacillus aurantiacus]SES10580.1 hypothetical protein SAMN05518684_10844 [Salipaludibacillus aurantiacus]
MKNDGRTIEKNKKELSLKSMYFNRYLMVRYASALFFFTNLYWFVSLVMSQSALFVLPLILLVVLIISIAEQVKVYSDHTNDAKYTRYCYKTLLVTNVILLLPVYFSSSFTQLYPFLINESRSKLMIFFILMTGILLSTQILRRLNKIKHNEDKHYKRIKQYEEVIN